MYFPSVLQNTYYELLRKKNKYLGNGIFKIAYTQYQVVYLTTDWRYQSKVTGLFIWGKSVLIKKDLKDYL